MFSLSVPLASNPNAPLIVKTIGEGFGLLALAALKRTQKAGFDEKAKEIPYETAYKTNYMY